MTWFNPFLGSYLFEQNGARVADARTMFHYLYTRVAPAMAIEMVGMGSGRDGHPLWCRPDIGLARPKSPCSTPG